MLKALFHSHNGENHDPDHFVNREPGDRTDNTAIGP